MRFPTTTMFLAAPLLAVSMLQPAAALPVAPQPGTAQPGADRRPQTSDGVRGEMARGHAPSARSIGLARKVNEQTWPMAPGITYNRWETVDPICRGKSVCQIRAHMVTVDLASSFNSFDYLQSTNVPSRSSVSYMAAQTSAVAAVNGDFFDISDTGAPLGMGMSTSRGFRNGPKEGWNNVFWVDQANRPHVGALSYNLRIAGRPAFQFTNFNSPTIAQHGMGAYTRAWGVTPGASVTDGQKRVREVVIEKGRVVSNRPKLSTGKEIKGTVLIARGMATAKLKQLTKGKRVQLISKVEGNPKMMIGGDRPILIDGVSRVINDREMHPRTAIGIDEDGNKLYLLVVDGRQSFSRGYTMVELANFFLSLGVENAINLDGGGSSALVGYDPSGTVFGPLNSPSDGKQRPVPNGLAVYSNPVSRPVSH